MCVWGGGGVVKNDPATENCAMCNQLDCQHGQNPGSGTIIGQKWMPGCVLAGVFEMRYVVATLHQAESTDRQSVKGPFHSPPVISHRSPSALLLLLLPACGAVAGGVVMCPHATRTGYAGRSPAPLVM